MRPEVRFLAAGSAFHAEPDPEAGNVQAPHPRCAAVASIRPLGVPGVFTDGRNLFTRSLVPGQSWYGERLVRDGGAEYRTWDPYRSKLAALLTKGWKDLRLRSDSKVLYLGAASGTTVSHISDICPEGTVYAIEVSRRVFGKLVELAETRANVLPILADASQPEAYRGRIEAVDLLYQDVAQRDQAGILEKNLRFLRTDGWGILFVKARSVDVARDPADVYREIRGRLRTAGVHVLGLVDLEPYEADHAAVVFEPGGGRP